MASRLIRSVHVDNIRVSRPVHGASESTPIDGASASTPIDGAPASALRGQLGGDRDAVLTRRVLPDVVAVEEPLELRANGHSFSVTMRTPGHDYDWAFGFLYSEGIIAAHRDVIDLRYCAGRDASGQQNFNVLDARLAPHVDDRWMHRRRQVMTTGACGVCGSSQIEDLIATLRHPIQPTAVPLHSVLGALDALAEHQPLFDRTGGIHGAALMRPDLEVLVAREDIGRHNAVDKVIGWALREERLPLRDTMLVVSSRASYELVQKAAMAGISTLIAASAPSSAAVELAQQTNMVLAAFVRNGRANIYAGSDRVVEDTNSTTASRDQTR